MDISEMAWGVSLWFDLWAVGIASASFIIAFIINRMSGGRRESLFRLSVYTGIVFALIGVTLLLLHLGHLLWFWHMFVTIRPLSVLSLGGWILSGWLTVAGVMAVLWIAGNLFKNLKATFEKIAGALSWVGFGLSFLLVTYGGVLIGTTNQPLWADTLMVPPLFIGSAVCSGFAWLILASLVFNRVAPALKGLLKFLWGDFELKVDEDVIGKMARGLVVTLVLNIVIVAAFLLWLRSASAASFDVLVSGELALLFWIGMVFIGIVLPFGMLLYNWSRGVSKGMAMAVAAGSSCLVIAGALILRAVILIGGQL
jgi:polysulfide reductase chain C